MWFPTTRCITANAHCGVSRPCAATPSVPVIVDAASEYDLRGFLAAGADIVVYSGHKFLGGPTAGIVAGRRDLIRAAYLQNIGIGRGMKIGKESIFGAIAALKAWETRDHAGIRAAEERIVANWKVALAGIEGVRAVPAPDPTGNPITRLQVELDPAILGFNAATAARALAERDPAVIVRNHQTELGFFQLDPCNLKDGQEALVATALREVLGGAPAPAAACRRRRDSPQQRRRRLSAMGSERDLTAPGFSSISFCLHYNSASRPFKSIIPAWGSSDLIRASCGEVPERLNGLDSKSSEGASPPRVRIPASPPYGFSGWDGGLLILAVIMIFKPTFGINNADTRIAFVEKPA